MANRGLPLYLATLLTGLLECIGFAGVLFGWTSLLFVFKQEGYFAEPCEQDCTLRSNATGPPGKGDNGFLREVEETGSWEVEECGEDSCGVDSTSNSSCQPVHEGGAVRILCVEGVKEGSIRF